MDRKHLGKKIYHKKCKIEPTVGDFKILTLSKMKMKVQVDWTM